MTRPLTTLSPLDGRYDSKTRELQAFFSEYGLIRYRVMVEIRYLIALCECPDLPSCPALTADELNYLQNLCDNFGEKDAAEVVAVEQGINHDVKAVEYYLRQRFESDKQLPIQQHFIHCGLTSEDTNNLAYALSIKDAIKDIVKPKWLAMLSKMRQFAKDSSRTPLLSRTHGQAASPTTVGKEWSNVAARLSRQIEQLQTLSILGKCNGAVGNHNAMAFAFPEVDWPLFSDRFIRSLELTPNPLTTQIEPHDWLAEFLHLLGRVHTILLDFVRDCWLYIATDVYQLQKKAEEVGSSTMPHKVNPIDFENAEGNLGIATALGTHLASKLPISRWQRDLSDSTVLRNLGVVLGYGVIAYEALSKGVDKLAVNVTATREQLDNNWPILTEAIQTLMKRYHIDGAYEALKKLSRGQCLDQSALAKFIDGIDLPADEKKRLKSLTPAHYTGYAATLSDMES